MSAGGLFPSNFFLQWLNIRGLLPIWFIVEILLFFKSIMNGLFFWLLSWQLHYWNITKFLSFVCSFSVKIFATFLKMIRKSSLLIKPIIGCFKCKIMSSANVNNLNSLSCFIFLLLLYCSKIQRTEWVWMCIILDVWGDCFLVFPLNEFNGFAYIFCYAKICSSNTLFLRDVTMKGRWTLSKAFIPCY